MEKIQVQIILEILGKPSEYVKESLQTLVTKLGSEKGFKILEKKYHDPKPVEESKGLFTAFADVTVELDTIDNYFGLLFAYLPSHIDIINPEKINLTNYDLNILANKLVQRLHEYDAIAKKIGYERDMFLSKLQEVAPQLFKQQEQVVQENEKSKTPKKKVKRKSN